MIKPISPKKVESQSIIKGLTLEDIENNLKKSIRGICENDNLDEFLEKAKSSNGKDGFFSVSSGFSHQNIEIQEEKLEEIDETIEIATTKKEISAFNFRSYASDSPKEKISNSSTFRFGLGPLESIEETKGEDMPLYRDVLSVLSHKSNQSSPRSLFVNAFRPQRTRKFTVSSSTKHKSRSDYKTRPQYFKSPYAETLHVSPQRLPAIKAPSRGPKIQGTTLNKRLKNYCNL
ncbi:hypothetical protein SteCoe_26041 [Stentor coeruleus]|uniref:Uncharacterized protein n=1 Tax=Stentor coeruleus TaxID=5963 RepID=A0A1R2BDV2_9CILI|nr:hypothetical protein SteCoe_26041 [Stentor coeruleus]